MLEKEIFNLGFRGNISSNINIGEKTAFKTKSLANFFIEPADEKSLSIILKHLKTKKENFFVLGGGNNTLINENGIKIVVCLKKFFNNFKILQQNNEEIYLTIESGAMLPKICWHCAIKGYSGLNALIGIPGTIGGAVFMNAGTTKGTIFSLIEKINIMDFNGDKYFLNKKEINPSYRKIQLNNIKDFIILDCTLKLKKNNDGKTIKEAKEFMKARKNSQPIKEKSCGCFFKNPENNLPAGMLIEKAGLKGKRIGGAKISEIHANFIINEKDCSASDILKLKNFVQEEVNKKFKVTLEPEVKIVGR
ncbi:MAG: UDP-N-acetylmuramate dehydrogenase [Desulforegulaceae bacterium]|nr:UDP-N-acetylmuramate dehydrogenase [Desulforegulaceae bacterium]